MAAFATYNDLQDRYDARVIAKYASDNETPVNIGGFSSNRRIAAALLDATGLITTACVYGNRYPKTVLDALAADADNGSFLRQITCALAMAQLLAGRVSGVDEIEEIVFGYKNALQAIEDLRNGKAVFNLPENIAATLPSSSAGSTNPYDHNRPSILNPIFGRFSWNATPWSN